MFLGDADHALRLAVAGFHNAAERDVPGLFTLARRTAELDLEVLAGSHRLMERVHQRPAVIGVDRFQNRLVVWDDRAGARKSIIRAVILGEGNFVGADRPIPGEHAGNVERQPNTTFVQQQRVFGLFSPGNVVGNSQDLADTTVKCARKHRDPRMDPPPTTLRVLQAILEFFHVPFVWILAITGQSQEFFVARNRAVQIFRVDAADDESCSVGCHKLVARATQKANDRLV